MIDAKKRLIFIWVILIYQLLHAQWFSFGRNKVQYYDFQWQILQTDHFDIYYYPEMEKVAEIGAAYAEESYAILEKKFEFTVGKRIPLIFYATHQHFQQTNITPGFIPEGVGGFFEFIKGRVVIPANGDMNSFKKVISHELVHVFMFYKTYKVNKEHGRVQGTYPPLWFTEGLAEYWSGDWNYRGEMIIKDAVLHNYLVPVKELYKINGTYMMYKEGEAVLRYIENRYGKEKILQLLENIWEFETFEEVFTRVLGIDFAGFDKEWIYGLKKRYYPLMAEHDLSYFIDPTIVKNGFNFKPAFYKTPEDSFVVFYTNRTGYSNIVSVPVRVLKFNEKEKPETIIAGEKCEDFEVFHTFNSSIDVNSEGLLAFSAKSGESDKLYIYDLKHKKNIDGKKWEGLISILSPSLSPDGEAVVFSGISFAGKADLYLWHRNDDRLLKLTDDFYFDDQPDFAPDGKRIIYVSDRAEKGMEGARDLMLLDLESGTSVKLTSAYHHINSPKWFPDGKTIVYIADHELQTDIWAVKIPETKDYENWKAENLQYYRLSKFLNGVWDVTVTEGGNLIYSVYENRSFQFRLMKPNFGDENEADLSANYLRHFGKGKEQFWQPGQFAAPVKAEKLNYTSKYQLDFAQTQVVQDPFWGTRGGGYVSFSDLLSNNYFNLMVFKDPQVYGGFFETLSIAASYINLKRRINYAVSLYRLTGRYYNFKDGFFGEDRVGASVAFSYPFTHFTRMDWSMNLDYSDKNVWGSYQRVALKHSQFISFINDNTIYYTTGPIDGHRFNLTVGHTIDIRYNNVNFYTLMVDFRNYFRLTTTSALAIRAMFIGNEGKETRWYYLGGSWDLRGYDQWSIRGDKAFLVSSELRYPFLRLLYFKFPFTDIGFPNIRGAVFCDMGNAWDETPGRIKGSIGVGWRINLGGFLVLRYDVGRKTDFRSVDDNYFTQFFFGWDF